VGRAAYPFSLRGDAMLRIRDGAIVKDLAIGADGIARARTFQPNEKLVMEATAEARDNNLARKMPWCQAALNVPDIKMAELERRYPVELKQSGPLGRSAFWRWWLTQAESAPYRLYTRKGKGRARR
jgi:hypothetical protein